MKVFVTLICLLFYTNLAFASESSLHELSKCDAEITGVFFDFIGDEQSIRFYSKFNRNSDGGLKGRIKSKAITLSQAKNIELSTVNCRCGVGYFSSILEIKQKKYFLVVSFVREGGWKISDISIDNDPKIIRKYVERKARLLKGRAEQKPLLND